MLRLFIIAWLLPGIALLPACSKEDDPAKTKKILSRIKQSTSEREDFLYDDQDRLIEERSSGGSSNSKTTYAYGQNTVTQSFYENGTFQYSLIWHLNNSGYLDYCNLPNGDKISLSYDSQGHMIKYTYKSSNGNVNTSDFVFADGNRVREINSGFSSESVLEYRVDAINTLSNEYNGKSFLGKDNKNLLQSRTLTNSDGTKAITFYDYELDSEGYVMKQYETTHYSNSSYTSESQYIYIYE